MNGVIVLPSLNRAKLCERFFKAFKETEAETPGLLLVDETDAGLEAYKELKLPPKWKLVVTKAVTMGDKVREVWEKIIGLDFVMILNDDHVPRTLKWDQIVVSQITGTNVVSTNDGPSPDKPWNAPGRICGAICFSGKVLRTLGYMFPEGMQHVYSDDVWGFLFSKAQCCQVLMDVCIEHDHAYKDATQRDETYKKINGEADFQSPEPKGGFWDTDRAAFKKWLETQAEDDARKLVAIQPKTGIMLAAPIQDRKVATNFNLGLMDVQPIFQQNNIYFEFARVEGSSLLPHARNTLVDMFMNSRCQKMLFIDSDQGFNRESVFRLFQSSRRIVAAISPHKRFPLNLNFEPLEEDRKYFKDTNNKTMKEFQEFAEDKADANGDIQVLRAGTGMMCIDRSVFDILKEKVDWYYAFDNDTKHIHREYFRMGSIDHRYRGEDWVFCMLAQTADIPIFVNRYAFISHDGVFSFDAQRMSS